MFWTHWPLEDLQDYLKAHDSGLMDRLATIIPPLTKGDHDPTHLYSKKNLIRIFEAFAPSDSFRDKKFREKCLNLLPPDELEKLAKALDVGADENNFADRRDAIVSKGWSDPVFCNKFIEYFDLPEHFLTPDSVLPDNYEDFTPPTTHSPITINSPYKPLIDYQSQVFFDTLKKLKVERSRFVIQMPTGAGKTRTAMEFITRYLNDSKKDNDVIVWLAHSEELCEQAYQCFSEVWPHVSRKKLRANRAWGSHSFPASYDMPMFIVAGFQKLHSEISKASSTIKSISSRISLIVVDEAHKTVAPTYKEVIKNLANDKTRIVGLTATPGRTIMEETEDLSKFYFQDIIGINCPDNKSVISMLKERKVLSELTYEPIVTDIKYTLTPAQKKKLESDFDFPPGFLDKMGNDDARNLEIMKRLLKECEEEKSILVFSCSVKHSQFITALLIYFGIKAAHVDGSTEKNRRSDLIEKFKSGELQVICNFGVLSTGFDAPNTDVVCITRPTNSAVLYSQMIGRGLRGPVIGGTPSCKLIDVRDNIQGFGDSDRVYRFFEEYW